MPIKLTTQQFIEKVKKVHGRRKHKFGFRRKRLQKLLSNFDPTKSELQNTEQNGIYRIYDCGKIKYEFKNKP